jgi:hypothetical protein
MYKTLSRALCNPKTTVVLRLATLVLLGFIAFYKIEDIELPTSLVDVNFILPLMLAGLMTILNLSFESMKYQILFGQELIGLHHSMRSVLAGMSVGIWTPNRAGEFLGRMRQAPEGFGKRAVGATLMGSLIQGLVTLLMGAFGVLYFQFPVAIELSVYWYILVFVILGVSVFFMIRKGPVYALRQKHFKVTSSQIGLAACSAALRYFVFSSQFVILLFAFGFQGDFIQAFSGVFVLYAIQTYLPGSLLSELGVREVLAVFLFAPYFGNDIGAALAAFCLWMLNIGLPITSWSVYASLRRLELR